MRRTETSDGATDQIACSTNARGWTTSLSPRFDPREDGFLVVELELDERHDHLGVGQQWVAEATGLSRPSRYLANVGLEEGPRGQCAGDDGDLTFNSESVRVTRDEERAYVDMFKHPRTGKNGYRTVWYPDRMRRNIAMGLMQILRPS